MKLILFHQPGEPVRKEGEVSATTGKPTPVYVNPQAVTAVLPSSDHTEIWIAGEANLGLHVVETLEEVITAINRELREDLPVVP